MTTEVTLNSDFSLQNPVSITSICDLHVTRKTCTISPRRDSQKSNSQIVYCRKSALLKYICKKTELILSMGFQQTQVQCNTLKYKCTAELDCKGNF